MRPTLGLQNWYSLVDSTYSGNPLDHFDAFEADSSCHQGCFWAQNCDKWPFFSRFGPWVTSHLVTSYKTSSKVMNHLASIFSWWKIHKNSLKEACSRAPLLIVSHYQEKSNVMLKAPRLIIAQKNHRHCFGWNESANKVASLGRWKASVWVLIDVASLSPRGHKSSDPHPGQQVL